MEAVAGGPGGPRNHRPRRSRFFTSGAAQVARAAADSVGAFLSTKDRWFFPRRNKTARRRIRRAVECSARGFYALRTLEACRPFGPLVTSNSTLSPSARLLKPWA